MPRCARKCSLHLLALVQSQQTGVDEHAGELIADRAMHQRGGNGRVDTPERPQITLSVADELADLLNLASTNAPGVQLGSARQIRRGKFAMQLAAARCVRDLRVKLHAVDRRSRCECRPRQRSARCA
jgi:hypothetical protein